MSTKQIEKSTVEIQIPDDVNVSLKGSMLHVQGPLGHVYKNFKKIPVDIQVDDKKILLKQTGERKKHYAIRNTAKSIIQTLCVGVVDGFTIKMKIVYSHFPITVKVEGKKVQEHFEIKENFNLWWMTLIAEKSPYRENSVQDSIKLIALETAIPELFTSPSFTSI